MKNQDPREDLINKFKLRVEEALDTVILIRVSPLPVLDKNPLDVFGHVWLEVVLPGQPFNIRVRAWELVDAEKAAEIERKVVAAARAGQ
jgi:hypothetical protein